ncbi:UDP-N-acetylglucosamine transferase subunit alg14 [Nannizzia gypsea CBS 118893]|uniref:UDP-N-acetylglucosamine transferase subunit ALG14 n=1 Tax=Arthroderma gypseum (strain ATCC MYA-4604 / CBS 118893) TaxID=535722 RepID=E5R2M2_ARTGP|nr:UDP-N-acetylglucosamine transferase subunit alg14 [Nannizzia gypsea CBS 118893]EFQ98680.1 UDP-N-acetylglucosamine transferase subunit alg14 [Nannizzia gypsea CBS 118893]
MKYLVLTGGVALLAFIFLVPLIICWSSKTDGKAQKSQLCNSVHLLIVLGSGGHTEEMLSMLRHAELDPGVYVRRTYIVGSGDSFSARKAREYEKSIESSGQTSKDESGNSNYTIITVPRARKVHQSFLTAPLSTLQCFGFCMLVLMGRHPDQLTLTASSSSAPPGYPDIILTNGPSTGVCVVVAARLLRLFDQLVCRILPQAGSDIPPTLSKSTPKLATSSIPKSRSYSELRAQRRGTRRYLRTIFIESWARVTTVSLSGKILFPLVDRFLVQWEGLSGYSGWFGFGRKAEYVGTLLS